MAPLDAKTDVAKRPHIQSRIRADHQEVGFASRLEAADPPVREEAASSRKGDVDDLKGCESANLHQMLDLVKNLALCVRPDEEGHSGPLQESDVTRLHRQHLIA